MGLIEKQVKTIAFPGISTGVYRFPKEQAAKIAITEVKAFLGENEELEEVIFVCFDESNYEIYQGLLSEV